MRSVTAFVQLGLGDGRVNQIGGYVGGGLTFTGPLPDRAQDMAGLAVAAARNGSHYDRAQTAGGIPTAGETTVELTYLAAIGSWLTLQPDLQYVIHPGGHTDDAECRGARAPHRGIALTRDLGQVRRYAFLPSRTKRYASSGPSSPSYAS